MASPSQAAAFLSDAGTPASRRSFRIEGSVEIELTDVLGRTESIATTEGCCAMRDLVILPAKGQ